MEVLGRYQQMTKGCGRQAQIDCCEILTYKANIIRINLGSQLPDMRMTTKAFRDVIAHERKYKALGKYDTETEPDFDGTMEMFFGHNRYDQVSDQDLFKAFVYMNSESIDSDPVLKLKKCGRCDAEEKMHGDFKKCSRCHEMPYCSKEVSSRHRSHSINYHCLILFSCVHFHFLLLVSK